MALNLAFNCSYLTPMVSLLWEVWSLVKYQRCISFCELFAFFQVKPQPPKIVYRSYNPISTNTGVKLKLECVSRGGNPAPRVLWFRNNITSSPLNSSASMVHEVDDTYTVTSWLDVVADWGDTFVCQSTQWNVPRVTQSNVYRLSNGRFRAFCFYGNKSF